MTATEKKTHNCYKIVGKTELGKISPLYKLVIFYCIITLPTAAVASNNDPMKDATNSMKKAIDLVGIKPYMINLTNEEQEIYPQRKSAIETTISSTYSKKSNTKTFQVLLSEGWRRLFAKSHTMDSVDNIFVKKRMQVVYSKYLCSYPPTRLLLNEGVTMSFQYMESDATYLFTTSFTDASCVQRQ